jgi:hypothetical protein
MQTSSSSQTNFEDLIPEEDFSSQEKRDDWLWIYIPILIALLLLAVGCIVIVRLGIGTPSAWADTSLIFLILPVMLLGLIPLVLFCVLIFGAYRLSAILPEGFLRAKIALGKVEDATKQVGDTSTRPFLVTQSFWAAIQAIFNWLASIVMIFKGETDD